MDIYEFAMKMEQDGEKYYRELAAKTSNIGLKNIFTMLADAEVTHYDVFKKWKGNEKVQVTRTKILSQVKNIFEEMKEKESGDTNVIRLEPYKKAQEIEKKSQDFYLKQANEVSDRDQEETFLRIADEEKKHFLILEEIIDFVSRPQSWLENPEWYHLEDY